LVRVGTQNDLRGADRTDPVPPGQFGGKSVDQPAETLTADRGFIEMLRHQYGQTSDLRVATTLLVGGLVRSGSHRKPRQDGPAESPPGERAISFVSLEQQRPQLACDVRSIGGALLVGQQQAPQRLVIIPAGCVRRVQLHLLDLQRVQA
jgi:hypothetical protein